MTWLEFLTNLSGIAQVTGNVIVLYYVLPAYRRTKHGAFILLGFAFMIATFDTVSDFTIGRDLMNPSSHLIYRTARRFSHLAVVGLETAAVVWLTQAYLRRFASLPPVVPARRMNSVLSENPVETKMEEPTQRT